MKMNVKVRLIIIMLATALSAGCLGQNGAQAPEANSSQEPSLETENPAKSVISEQAATAFEGLDPVPLQQGEGWRVFRIDPAASMAAYVVDEELFSGAASKYGLEIGKVKVTGETQDVEGLLQIDPTLQTLGANRFAVYLPTLQTDQSLRDGWIRENALESDRYPLAIFMAERLQDLSVGYEEGKEARFKLEGELAIRGKTVPTVWSVAATLSGNTIRGSMQTTLQMTALGFDPPNFAGTLTVKDEFVVKIDFSAVEE